MLLSHTLHLLPEMEHIVVHLFESKGLQANVYDKACEVICLNNTGWKSMPSSIFKLRSIIKRRKPILVHSHLFYSTLLTRLAIPSSVPLVSTIHSLYSKDAFEKNNKSLLVEKLTIKKKHALIAVSQFVLKDYLTYVPFEGKKFVLYNFIPASFFKMDERPVQNGIVKCIAIGNLKEAKNYPYLLSIFRQLKDEAISLDIYGTGSLEKELQQTIVSENLNVRLCGNIDDVYKVLPEYDLFLQASAHEGFGLSVIEAMAARLPLALSDIPVFREVTNGLAHFFPLDDALNAAALIKQAVEDKSHLRLLSDQGYSFVREHYSSETYLRELLRIYEEVSNNKLKGLTCVA